MRMRSESKEAIQDHKDAKKKLQQVSSRTREETAEYHAANKRVADTEARVSFFRR